MRRLYLVLSILFLSTGLISCIPRPLQPAEAQALENPTATGVPERNTPPEVVPHDPPASCSVTIRQDPPFTAPEPYSPDSPFDSNFWYGSRSLWTDLTKAGVWYGLPHNPAGYTQKIFWWREGYLWNEEPEPELTVTGERLDASASALIVSRATNAYAGDIGSAMLVGVDFPTFGCWKITGKYADAELSFVVWVAP